MNNRPKPLTTWSNDLVGKKVICRDNTNIHTTVKLETGGLYTITGRTNSFSIKLAEKKGAWCIGRFVLAPEPIEPPPRKVSVRKAVEVLNRALMTDPEALNELFNARVNCNQALADDPTIQVGVQPGETGRYWLTFLGLLNGIFGIDKEKWGAIVGIFDTNDDGRIKLIGFEDNKRVVNHGNSGTKSTKEG